MPPVFFLFDWEEYIHSIVAVFPQFNPYMHLFRIQAALPLLLLL
jgi:hypothetical protein